jgi:hypothetical protein
MDTLWMFYQRSSATNLKGQSGLQTSYHKACGLLEDLCQGHTRLIGTLPDAQSLNSQASACPSLGMSKPPAVKYDLQAEKSHIASACALAHHKPLRTGRRKYDASRQFGSNLGLLPMATSPEATD